jgi:hypothetical protein
MLKLCKELKTDAQRNLRSAILPELAGCPMVVDVEPCMAFSADYSDWTTGNQRVLKRWPRVRSR